MKRHLISHIPTLAAAWLAVTLTACGSGTRKSAPAEPAALPQVTFNADSAYSYVAMQTSFGPRVPGSESHTKCVEWMVSKMEQLGATVSVQELQGTAYDGTPIPVRNITASYRPDRVNRILLCAHYDSRPWADHDEDKSKRDTPISGANDGASGVGVLMEIGRQLQAKAPRVGVDIIFFDAEDGGTPDHIEVDAYRPDTWCIGSQLWAKSEAGQRAEHRYGILLDMVGGKEPRFPIELYSKSMAPEVVEKIWSTAERLNYGNIFPRTDGGYITDDHMYVNKLTRVPVADIIHYDSETGNGFCSTWHTHADVLENIERSTLAAVGEVVLTVVYSE